MPSPVLDCQRHGMPFRFFWAVNRPHFKWLFATIGLYSFGALFLLSMNYFLGRVVDALSNDPARIPFLLTMLMGCVIFQEIFYRTGHICEITGLSRFRQSIKRALFDHTTRLSFGYFADRFAGELAHRIAKTADAFERLAMIFTDRFLGHGVTVVLSIFFLGSVNRDYGWFIVLWVVFFIVGSLFFAGEMNRRAGIYATEEARTTGSIVDIYGNIAAFKVYGKSENLNRAWQQIAVEKQAFLNLGWWEVFLFIFQGLAIMIICAGLIGITTMLYKKGLITVGEIVFVGATALRFFYMAWEDGKNIADFVRYRGEGIQNLKDLIVPPLVLDGPHTALEYAHQVEVQYHNVTFSYNEKRRVLDHFSFSIEAGEKVGIVGLSGAGKTTFANLLLRFFDPQEGAILLNKTDIRGLTQEFLRSHISYISQDTSLFHTTISENIAYGSSSPSEAKIKEAALLAYADDFIQTLPQGYGSIVGERGVKLSGGQRQRIAIARALLANRPLFLLDEATSALDSESEGKIQKGLIALMKNKTVIAIAHRLSTLAHMDRIVFFEDGKIVEEGTHAELLARSGKYAQLWQMQAGGFLPETLVTS